MATYKDFFNYVDVNEKPNVAGQKLGSLSLEIWTKFQTNQQTATMFNRKVAICEAVCQKLQGVSYVVEIMGSTLSGIGINSSDLDLVLLRKAGQTSIAFGSASQDEATGILRGIAPLLSGIGSPSKPVLEAKTPILQFTEGSIEVDISVGPNLDGLKKTYLLWAFCKLDPRVRPLIIIVKLWAKRRGINNPRLHSLSGYALALMVIHYLQQPSSKLLPSAQTLSAKLGNLLNLDYANATQLKDVAKKFLDQNRSCKATEHLSLGLGELLTGFFYYYMTFDFDYHGISVLSGKMESRYSLSNSAHEWKFICIQDPVDKTNASKSVHDALVFSQIKNAFKDSYTRLFKEQRLSALL